MLHACCICLRLSVVRIAFCLWLLLCCFNVVAFALRCVACCSCVVVALLLLFVPRRFCFAFTCVLHCCVAFLYYEYVLVFVSVALLRWRVVHYCVVLSVVLRALSFVLFVVMRRLHVV